MTAYWTIFERTLRLRVTRGSREIRIVVPWHYRYWRTRYIYWEQGKYYGARYIYWEQGKDYGADKSFGIATLFARIRWVMNA